MSRNNAVHYCRSEEQLPENAIHLPLLEHVDKKNLLTALGEACKFPEYYALNWDAAWDCLHDCEDIYHIVLDLRQSKYVDRGAMKEMINLINDAYDAWLQPELWILQNERKENKHKKNYRRKEQNREQNNDDSQTNDNQTNDEQTQAS